MKSLHSKPYSFNGKDVKKSVQVFLWNASSLLAAILVAILSMPVEELPSWLLWIVPLAPLINVVLYSAKRWYEDNR